MSLAPTRFLAIALSTVAISPALAETANYKVDAVHSTVLFKIQHFGAGNFYGRFNGFDGTIVHDEADASKNAITLNIKADSIDTANAKRDDHVKGPDFLNVAQFPTITFKSKEVKKVDDKNFELTGDVTLHGVTKPVTAKVEVTGKGKDPKGGERAGAEAKFTLKRSDFGMNYMPGALGDEIGVIVALEATKEAAAPKPAAGN